MSNIFEIDGEIEDNDDDNKNSGEGGEENLGSEETAPESTEDSGTESEEESVSIVFGDAEDDSETEEPEALEEETKAEEVPWFDKVLNESEEEKQAEEEVFVSTESEAEYVSSAEETVDEPEEPIVEESYTSEEAEEVEDEPRVEDVTQEEIEEVLAELDQSEKEMQAYDEYNEEEDIFDEEEPPVADAGGGDEPPIDDEEESFDDIFPRSNRQPIGPVAWTFVTLFLIMLSLFAYYQFYDGEHFSINFEHRSKGAMNRLDSLAQLNEDSQEEIAQLMKRMEELTADIRQKTAAYEALKNDTTRSTYAVDETGESNPTTEKIDLNSGVFYQVQLIALQQYHPDFEGADFSFYVDKEDGYSKMLMGAFTSEEQAMDLYKKVQRSGFNDAFIVKKVNGARVEYDPNK